MVTRRSGRAPGGGDPSLRLLARRTATKLAASGLTKVRLRYDASLFAPPRASAAWPPGYIETGVVAPVTALSIGDAQVADPVQQAVDAFVGELSAAGVAVRGPPTSVVADTDAAELAAVESRPVGVLLERMLTTSDNDYAEAFGHLAAVAGGEPATFEGGAAATMLRSGSSVSPPPGSSSSTRAASHAATGSLPRPSPPSWHWSQPPGTPSSLPCRPASRSRPSAARLPTGSS